MSDAKFALVNAVCAAWENAGWSYGTHSRGQAADAIVALLAKPDLVLRALGIRPLLPYDDPTGGVGPLWTKDEE